MNDHNAIRITKNEDGESYLTVSKGVPHAFEVYSEKDPSICIHSGQSNSYKIGIRESGKPEKGLLRIVQANQGHNPNVAPPGISMTPKCLVGIGTDSPTERLEVNGNIKLSGDLILPSDFKRPGNQTAPAESQNVSLKSLFEKLFAQINQQQSRIEQLEKKIEALEKGQNQK